MEVLNLLLQLFPGGGLQGGVIKVHPEIDLVNDFQQIDFKLHGAEHGALYGENQLAGLAQAGVDVLPDGVPQPQEFHIVAFDVADGAQIVQLFLGKAQGTQVVDLRVDFLKHFGSEHGVLVPALKIVFAVQVRVLVENHLIHVEFIQIGVQQGNDNGFQFHTIAFFIKYFRSANGPGRPGPFPEGPGTWRDFQD